jgi:hypothetical protein
MKAIIIFLVYSLLVDPGIPVTTEDYSKCLVSKCTDLRDTCGMSCATDANVIGLIILI